MGFFDFLKQPDTDQGEKKIQRTSGAVRTLRNTGRTYPAKQKNPLQTIDRVSSVADNKDTALYVCCQSDARSRHAAGLRKRIGYTSVNIIGGSAAYAGKVER